MDTRSSLTRDAGAIPVMLVIGQLELGGGAEWQLAQLALRLEAHGFRPVVVSLRAGGGPGAKPGDDYWARHLREHGIRVHELRRAGHRDIRRLLPLIRLLKAERPALVHSFLLPANAYARVAAVLAGARPVLLAAERSAGVPESRFERGVDRLLLRFTDGFITNADAVRRLLLARGARAPIWVVPNGIESVPESSEARALAREALRMEAEVPLVGMVARMSSEKDYPLFLDVVERLRARLPRCRAVAVGDGPLRHLIEREIRRRGLGPVVHLAGRVARAADLIPAFDVCVLTSKYEGLSNALLEAQAAGVPCVATRVGGNDEIIVEGETGHLLPPGSAAAFAGQVERLLLDPARRALMGRRARERVRREFSIDRMVEATVEVYRTLLRRGAGGDSALVLGPAA